MAATNAKKLESIAARDAARQARRRARMNMRGKPDSGVCDRAIVEALAYTLASTPTTEGGVRGAMISVSTLTATMVAILVDREGYKSGPTAEALKLRLGQREAHEDPSFTPSLVPDPMLRAERLVRGRSARLMANISNDNVEPEIVYPLDTGVTSSDPVT